MFKEILETIVKQNQDHLWFYPPVITINIFMYILGKEYINCHPVHVFPSFLEGDPDLLGQQGAQLKGHSFKHLLPHQVLANEMSKKCHMWLLHMKPPE